MATINPYMTPAEQPMLDTYVPIPFQELMQAGAMTQTRYEDSLARDEAFNLDVDKLQGYSKIEVPGAPGTYVPMPDAKKVSDFKVKMNQALDDLATSIPDKASPEYRAKQKALYSDFKRAISPSGEIGIALSNIGKVDAFNKLKRDNPQLADDPSLYYPFMQKILQYNKDTSEGKVVPLDLEGAVGEYVDVNKELSDLINNIGTIGSEELKLQGIDNIQGLYRALTESGVGSERIMGIVQNAIQDSPKLLNTLVRQASYDKQITGDTRDINDIINDKVKSHAMTMGALFQERTIKSQFVKDEAALAKAKKTNDRLNKYYSSNLVLPTKGTGIENSSDLIGAFNKASDAVTATKRVYDDFISNFPLDNNGSVIPVIEENGVTTDYSEQLNEHIKAIYNAEKKVLSLNNLENQADEKTGLNEIRRSEGYQKEFVFNKNELKRAADYALNSGFRTGGNVLTEGYGVSFDEYKNASPEQKDALVDRAARYKTDHNYSESKRAAKEKDDFLEERSKDKTFVAGATILPDDLGKKLMKVFKTRSTSKSFEGDLSGFNIKTVDAHTLEELNPSETLDDVDLSKSEFGEFFLDSDGMPTVTYNLYNEDQEFVRKVKQEAPKELISDLRNDGLIKEADLIASYYLRDDLGVLHPNIKEQTYPVTSTDGKAKQNVKIVETSPGVYLVKPQSKSGDGKITSKAYTVMGANNLIDKLVRLQESLDILNSN